jgi:NitT/TauT family transport system substrate-binding protein
LIGSKPRPNFQLADLLDARIAIVKEVPTPWYCLQEDLRRSGLDPAKLKRTPPQSMKENTDALRHGEMDVIQVLEPFAEELIASGAGHLWYAASLRGHTSYTSFYTRRPILESRRREFTAMTRAIFRTQRWVQTAASSDIARVVATYFPDIPQERLSASFARYQKYGVWGKDPCLPRSGYDRLKAGVLSAGATKTDVPFEDAVDNSMAEAVVAENPPPVTARL